MHSLTPKELERYRDQLRLRSWGTVAQEKLKASTVAIVGLGGLGSHAALKLAAAGVGTLLLFDDDVVSLSNLHRQTLYADVDVGHSKVDVARQQILRQNPLTVVCAICERFTDEDTLQLSNAQLLLDCTDNFESRYAVNRAAVRLAIPLVSGAASGGSAQVAVLAGSEGACYECLYPESTSKQGVDRCNDGGVIPTAAALAGILQANEALKRLIGINQARLGRLMNIDLLDLSFHSIDVSKRADCVVCGSGVRDVANRPTRPHRLQPRELAEWRETKKQHLLVDLRQEYERDIASLGGLEIPFEELEARHTELDTGWPIVLYCHIGIRSREAATLLVNLGYHNIYDLAGGIDRWSVDVDPSLHRY